MAQLVKNASGFARGERGRKADRPPKGERSERPQRTERVNSFEHTDRFDRTDRTERFDRVDRVARGDRRDVPPEKRGDERRERPPRISLDPAVSDTIFVGIGKTRNVHPKDIVGLLVGVAGLERNRIGDIRVLSNYSFVQLYSEDCQKAIDALDGYEYRGRKLGVSFSRKKSEDDQEIDVMPTTNIAQDTASVETSSADQAVIDTIVVQQESGIPSFEETTSSDEIPKDVTSDSESADGAIQAENTPQDAAPQDETIQGTAEGVETSDDGQVSSHFGDGAAY